MNKNPTNLFIFLILLLTACSTKETTQIAENTFVHGDKVYKLIDNEIREIGDLSVKEIKKFEVSKVKERDLGTTELDYVKLGATTSLKALYRGNYLYYRLRIFEFSDLKSNYYAGNFTIGFIDEFQFVLHSAEIPSSELVQVMDENNQIVYFEFNGKTEMSTEINSAIKRYSVTSSARKR